MIKFRKATNSNTPAYVLHIGDQTRMKVYISYETVVAASICVGGALYGCRIESPSRTTSKHLKEMGVKDFEVVSEEKLDGFIRDWLREVCANAVERNSINPLIVKSYGR